MEADIQKTATGIEIDVTDLQGKQAELLEAFQACSEGRCTCPTQEYQKVADLEVSEGDDLIQLSLVAKDGETIGTHEIEQSLNHTRKAVEG